MSHVDEGTLHAYLDGELSASDRASVDAHLAECSACRAALAEERALLERATTLLGAARPVERPAPPLDQLKRTQRRSWWRVPVPVAWAASILLALGVGYYMGGSSFREAPAAAHVAPVSVRDSIASTARAPAPAVASGREAAPGHRFAQGTQPRRPAMADQTERSRERADSATVLARQNLPAAPRFFADSTLAGRVRAANAPQTDSLSRALDRSSVRLEAVVVTAAPAVAGKAVPSAWPIIPRSTARSLLGTDVVGLPGLMTRAIRRGPVGDNVVVVEQALDSGTVIQIFQRPAGRTLSDSLKTRERADHLLARFVGKLRVEIAGPVSVDSLNRLLDQVRPLP